MELLFALVRQKVDGKRFDELMKANAAVRESVNKSAVSAASPDYVNFQAVIKSAASAASPKAKSKKPKPRGAPRGRHLPARQSPGRSPGSWFL